jgi:hypothetical protein
VQRTRQNIEVDVHAIKSKVEGIEGNVEGMEAVTEDVVSLRDQARGAGTLRHWLIKTGIYVVGFAGWATGICTYLTGRPPP